MIALTYALGLLALIGIPIIIIIYIIKNKYTEQTVTSTYLWTLSERFVRKRVPINRIVGLISLILQIIAVILTALLIAHPIIILKDSASAYCFVLDGSGSMNIEQNGSTRFELGKDRISGMIKDAADGSTYTLIFAGTSADTIYSDIDDKDRALDALSALSPSDVAPDPIDALDAAQKYFDDHRFALNYLITDKQYERIRNITVIDVTENAAAVENYSIESVTYVTRDGSLYAEGSVKSYGGDATLDLELSISTETGKFVPSTGAQVEVAGGESAPFSLKAEGVTDFSALKVTIKNADALASDSEQIVYNVANEKIGNTLVVSDDKAFFIRGALKAAGNNSVDLCTTEEYAAGDYSSYGLYVFIDYAPEIMPEDGAVWFIDPPGTVEGANFTYQGPASAKRPAEYSTSSASVAKKLLAGVSGRQFEVDGYAKCGVSAKFTTIASVDGSSIIFAGSNIYGNREAVFAFSLNSSGPFTLSADFVTIVGNLLDYSFPAVVDGTSYHCGDALAVNVLTGCESIRVITPLGGSAYLDTSVAVSEYRLTEAGTYEICLTMKNGDVRTINVFASMPEEERAPVSTGLDFRITGLQIASKFDGFYDNLLIIFIILAVVAVADFGVYCYEQYQLR